MSARNLDKHNRFRCITVGFRVSPEEHEHINVAVALSGLSKQEYCYRRCLGRDMWMISDMSEKQINKDTVDFIMYKMAESAIER